MLSEAQLDELDARGTTRVPQLIAADTAAAIEDRIWAFLTERDGVDRDDPATWPERVGKLQPLRRAGVFDAFDNELLAAIADQLLGTGWDGNLVRPQALVSFPGTGEWALPTKVWHFDMPARGPVQPLGAVRIIGFVSQVVERGGGTLVVEGSHRLVEQLVEQDGGYAGQSADVRKRLARRSQWFASLNRHGDPAERITQLMDQDHEVDGVRVRVAELTGESGDIVVMHPWTMHNIAANRADRPRMMFSYTIYAKNSVFLGPRVEEPARQSGVPNARL